MDNEKQTIGVIVGSQRTPRACPQIANFVLGTIRHYQDQKASRSTFDFKLIDIAAFDLPFFDEPGIPSKIQSADDYVHEHTRAWSSVVSELDAFVFVTPQCNWGIPAGLKNAIDYPFHEWKGKPAMIVSYGGHGGDKCATALSLVLGGGIGVRVVERTVNLTFPNREFLVAATKGRSIAVPELIETLKQMDDKISAMAEVIQRGSVINASAAVSLSSDRGTAPSIDQLSPQQGEHGRHCGSMPRAHNDPLVEEFSLFQKHLTAPHHILSWPCSALKLTNAELQYPVQLEIQRPKLPECTSIPSFVATSTTPDQGNWLLHLSASQMSHLAHFYFSHFHPSYLILDEGRFYSQDFSVATRTNFAKSLNTCTVLLVCALGTVVARHSGQDEWLDSNGLESEDAFFSLADSMLHSLEVPNWATVQCLLLMGLFYSAKLRVYEAWNVIHRACCIITLLSSRGDRLEYHHGQLFWIAYLQESQILAEYDFPSSGLGNLVSHTPLPSIPDDEMDVQRAQYQFFFLAMISMRKLLNRILFHLYRRETRGDAQRLEPTAAVDPLEMYFGTSQSLTSELDRQLEEWRAWLPPSLQFSNQIPEVDQIDIQENLWKPRDTRERLRGHLMARYYAAKGIIHRQYLFRVLHSADERLLSETEINGALTALCAAFLCVVHGGAMNEPLPLLLHPINSWKSLFAVDIEIHFVLPFDSLRSILPRNWIIIKEVRQKMVTDGVNMSPTIARDAEILQSLEFAVSSMLGGTS
ncbi:NAD(P)H-dependent FMN reductase LOT6 [Paramyrothecium foliicola]|nr:NAD(P)H-dependent FMN reductase LOT6 [Paramyrothecium foliicola]